MIRLDFPVPVRDDDNGHDNSGLLIATPGCRRLDGDQALALARSRYDQYRGADSLRVAGPRPRSGGPPALGPAPLLSGPTAHMVTTSLPRAWPWPRYRKAWAASARG